jgi:hypothetical protein
MSAKNKSKRMAIEVLMGSSYMSSSRAITAHAGKDHWARAGLTSAPGDNAPIGGVKVIAEAAAHRKYL